MQFPKYLAVCFAVEAAPISCSVHEELATQNVHPIALMEALLAFGFDLNIT